MSGERVDAQIEPQPEGLSARLGRFYQGSAILSWPLTDLAMRFFIALHFWRSGLVKASDWETAVYLATHEYPVDWMEPVTAAATGLSIELIAPALLLFGFLSRPAALALAALTVVAQIEYLPTTTNLMLIAMLIWYCAYGPAAMSLDFAWVHRSASAGRRGLIRLALIGRWVRERIAPWLLVAMRVWLATALLALAGVLEPSIALATWLPTTSFTGMPDWLAVVFAALLLLGFAASPVAYALTFIIAAFMIAGAHPDVTFYPILLFGVYDARGAGPLSLDGAMEFWMRKKFGWAKRCAQDDSEEWLETAQSSLSAGRSLYRKTIEKIGLH